MAGWHFKQEQPKLSSRSKRSRMAAQWRHGMTTDLALFSRTLISLERITSQPQFDFLPSSASARVSTSPSNMPNG